MSLVNPTMNRESASIKAMGSGMTGVATGAIAAWYSPIPLMTTTAELAEGSNVRSTAP
jgi:hypothetical protein